MQKSIFKSHKTMPHKTRSHNTNSDPRNRIRRPETKLDRTQRISQSRLDLDNHFVNQDGSPDESVDDSSKRCGVEFQVVFRSTPNASADQIKEFEFEIAKALADFSKMGYCEIEQVVRMERDASGKQLVYTHTLTHKDHMYSNC